MLQFNTQQPHQPDSCDPDVVIIGAGPTGLWTAINILTQAPQMKVRLYERYQTYIRVNKIRICTKEEFNVSQDSPLAEIFANPTISILDVEKILLTEAKKLGAEIVYETIEEIETLFARHPGTKRWIGCDGAHSKLRTKFYGPTVDLSHYHNVVQVSYCVEKATKGLSEYRKQKLASQLDMIVEETVENENVILRFFAKDEIFETVKKFIFKAPCTKIEEIANEKLAHAIKLWINTRFSRYEDEIMTETFKLTTFKLGAYRSAQFCHEENGKIFALCGDSAFGVPFYRSMRNGWVSANILTKFLFEDSFVNNYEKEMEDLYVTEKTRAKVIAKNLRLIGINSMPIRV